MGRSAMHGAELNDLLGPRAFEGPERGRESLPRLKEHPESYQIASTRSRAAAHLMRQEEHRVLEEWFRGRGMEHAVAHFYVQDKHQLVLERLRPRSIAPSLFVQGWLYVALDLSNKVEFLEVPSTAHPHFRSLGDLHTSTT